MPDEVPDPFACGTCGQWLSSNEHCDECAEQRRADEADLRRDAWFCKHGHNQVRRREYDEL